MLWSLYTAFIPSFQVFHRILDLTGLDFHPGPFILNQFFAVITGTQYNLFYTLRSGNMGNHT